MLLLCKKHPKDAVSLPGADRVCGQFALPTRTVYNTEVIITMENATNHIKLRQPRKTFNIIRSVREIEAYTPDLPDDGECYKYISTGGFSAISFIRFVSSQTVINHLLVTTLRVGKKELKELDRLHRIGDLDRCTIITSGLMKDDSKLVKSYGYYDNLVKVCDKNKWELKSVKNHSKLLLMDTDNGKFVIETSSNLNENPKIEQFSFEKSDELFDFYLNVINEVMLC